MRRCAPERICACVHVMSDARTPTPTRPTLVIRVGARDHPVSVGLALVVLAAFLGGVVALLVWVFRSQRWTAAALLSPMALSAWLWIAFFLYWGAAAANASKVRSSEPLRSRGLHTLMMNAAILIALLPVPGLGWRWLPRAPALGLAVQIVGFLLAAWARRHLGRNWSGEVTVKVDHELVRSGPYRLVRHPIYTAMIGMVLGTAIVSSRLHGLAGLALIAFAYARKIRIEERVLAAEFGAAWDDYRRRSRALVPWSL